MIARARLPRIASALTRAAKDVYVDGELTELNRIFAANPKGKQDWTLYEWKKDPNVLVLSFRGTMKVSDWVRDAKILTEMHDVTGMDIHSGFYYGVENQLDDIEKTMMPVLKPNSTVYITGHSLGGACAVVFAHHLFSERNKGSFFGTLGSHVDSVYTFGAPRAFTTVNAEFRDSWNDKVHNFVNGFDIVPRSLGGGKRFRSGPIRTNVFAKMVDGTRHGILSRIFRGTRGEEGDAGDEAVNEEQVKSYFDDINILLLPRHLASFQPFGKYYYGLVDRRQTIGAIEERFVAGNAEATKELIDEMMDFALWHKRPSQLLAHHSMNAYSRMIEDHMADVEDRLPLASTTGFVHETKFGYVRSCIRSGFYYLTGIA